MLKDDISFILFVEHEDDPDLGTMRLFLGLSSPSLICR
jgi:hypothetical protein